jgi:hypothetical protein
MEQELGVGPPPREWSDESSEDDDNDREGEVAENSAAAVNKRT